MSGNSRSPHNRLVHSTDQDTVALPELRLADLVYRHFAEEILLALIESEAAVLHEATELTAPDKIESSIVPPEDKNSATTFRVKR